MKVSLIVAIYNVEKYLEKCLNSLHRQTYEDLEILCINDGASDNSQSIIDKYVKLDKRFKSYIKENGGLSDARNYGLKRASGDLIMFMDGDDYADEKMVEASVFYLERFNLDIFVFNYKQIYLKDNKEEVMVSKVKNGVYNLKKNPEILAYTANCAWNKIYKKELFVDNDIQYPKGLHHEDLATTFRLLYYAKRVGYEDRPLYNYIIDRPNNVTSSVNKSIYDIIKVADILLGFYIEKEAFDTYYDELNYLIERNYLQALRKVIKSKDKDFVYKFIDDIFASKKRYFKRKNQKYKIEENRGDNIYLSKTLLKMYYRYYHIKGGKNA